MSVSTRKQEVTRLFNLAFEESYSSVYKFCLSKLNNSHLAEDCVQETFLVYYNKLLAGEEFLHTKAFLLKTANNFVLKKCEEVKKSYNTVSIEEVINIPSQSEDIDDRLTFEEYSRQISAALSDSDAELFSMRYIEELKIDVIAERCNMSITAVTTRLSRLRKKLKKLFEEELR